MTSKQYTREICRDKRNRLNDVGQRVVGGLRIHIDRLVIVGATSTICDDVKFVRIRLRCGTHEQLTKVAEVKDGEETRFTDEYFDLPIRLKDFEGTSAVLDIFICGGSKKNELRELNAERVRFLRLAKDAVVKSKTSPTPTSPSIYICTYYIQWCAKMRHDQWRTALFDFFIALDEARDESKLYALDSTDLGSSRMAENTQRIVKVFNCIVGLQRGLLEIVLWRKPKYCIILLILWSSCCIWPQIIFSLPAWAFAFVLHLRLRGLRDGYVDVGGGDLTTTTSKSSTSSTTLPHCTNCGCGAEGQLRSCSGCGQNYCSICKYLYMLREDRNTWSHVHCQKGTFMPLSERPLSMTAHKRNARGMQNVMAEICDGIDFIDTMWHQGLRDHVWVRKMQTAAIALAPVCCALGAIVPLWLVCLFTGWVVLCLGNPYVRGAARFLFFWCRYDDAEVVVSRRLCGCALEGDVEDDCGNDDTSFKGDDDETAQTTMYEVVSEVQQRSVLSLSRGPSSFVPLAWLPTRRQDTKPPRGCEWTDLWSRHDVEDSDWEYTDGYTDVKYVPIEEFESDQHDSSRTKKPRANSACPSQVKMWILAAKRFATPPYSNGSDARYERVKKELRDMYGSHAINSLNKPRLKHLALSRGAQLSISKYHKNQRSGDQYRRRLWRRHYRRKNGSATTTRPYVHEGDGALVL